MSHHYAPLPVTHSTPNDKRGFLATTWTFSYSCLDGVHQLRLERMVRETKLTSRHKVQARELYCSTFKRDSPVKDRDAATPEDVRAEARRVFLQGLLTDLTVTV